MSTANDRFRVGWRVAKPHFARHWRAYALGLGFLAATNGFQLALPWLLKQGVDALSSLNVNPGAIRVIQWAAAGILIAAVAQAVVRVASRWVLFRVGRDVEFEIRQQAYRHLLDLDAGYYQARSRGDLISRVSNDITNIRLLFGFGVLNVANTVFAFAGALTIMMGLSWQLTLLAVLPFPLMLVFLKRISLRLHERFLGAQQTLGGLSGFLQESIQGYEVVKGFAQEGGFYRRFQDRNQANYEANMRLAWTRSALMPLMLFVGGFGMFTVLAGGGYFVIRGDITIGGFAAFQGYLGMLVWPTLALGWLFNVLERGLASLMRVREVLDTEPAIRDHPDAVDVELKGGLSMAPRDLVVGDPERGRSFALKQVAFDAAPGEKIAVVGRTGSGKSMLLKLLLRVAEVPPGVVRYDGRDVHELGLDSLRRQVGYLPQEPFLFGRTVRDALTVGLGERDDDTLWRALEEAAIAAEVRALSHGLDTRLGERGVSLSGGQRQRLMLARLLMAGPKLLLFDDPLSALDFKTADRVRQTLERFAEGRTLLWATHRLSGMEWFDQILLFDNGAVAARGTHEELLNNPVYGSLFERQRLMRTIEEHG